MRGCGGGSGGGARRDLGDDDAANLRQHRRRLRALGPLRCAHHLDQLCRLLPLGRGRNSDDAEHRCKDLRARAVAPGPGDEVRGAPQAVCVRGGGPTHERQHPVPRVGPRAARRAPRRASFAPPLRPRTPVRARAHGSGQQEHSRPRNRFADTGRTHAHTLECRAAGSEHRRQPACRLVNTGGTDVLECRAASIAASLDPPTSDSKTRPWDISNSTTTTTTTTTTTAHNAEVFFNDSLGLYNIGLTQGARAVWKRTGPRKVLPIFFCIRTRATTSPSSVGGS